MLQRGKSGDGCVLASTLCKYDLRMGDLFALSWARVRRVMRGSISSELLMCGGGGAIWLNHLATVLFSVCSAVTVECCVLFPCCMGVFGMFVVM